MPSSAECFDDFSFFRGDVFISTGASTGNEFFFTAASPLTAVNEKRIEREMIFGMSNGAQPSSSFIGFYIIFPKSWRDTMKLFFEPPPAASLPFLSFSPRADAEKDNGKEGTTLTKHGSPLWCPASV
jgi:hypothetical protein